MDKKFDDFVQENGEVITEETLTDNIIDKDTVQEYLEGSFNKLAYEDDCPIPGKPIDNVLNNQINSIDKDSAMNSLINKAALLKAQKEAEHNISPEEKARRKKEFIDMMMYQQGEDYYTKYHYMMDGKTKRTLRRKIERNYDKGRYKKYTEYNENGLNG